MSPEEHRKFLKEVDERVLPRRKLETDEEYAKRMYALVNNFNYDKSERK